MPFAPGAGKPKESNPALWLFGALGTFLFAGTLLLLLGSGQQQRTSTVELPDGSRLTLKKVRYGTSYSYEDQGRFRSVLQKFAPNVYRWFYRHTGSILDLRLKHLYTRTSDIPGDS